MAAEVWLMPPRLQEVGTALHPSSADETRARVAGNGLLAADGGGQKATAANSSNLYGRFEGSRRFLSNDDREQSPFRSPSPEYVDAVQEPQLQEETMGETVAQRDSTNEVEGSKVEQRLTLPRDPTRTNCSSSDLGIGIRVTGGVKCEKCGELHTVITDVTGDLPPRANLYKGQVVMEWCGHAVDGASYEEVRSVISRTEEETTIQMTVKECSGSSLPKAEDEGAGEPLNIDVKEVASQVPEFTGSPRHSPSSSTDREASYTPKSLSPTPSPIRSRTCTPSHSASSTPSPTPPPSPNLPRRGPAKKQNFDPLSVSINLPVTQPVGGVVTPKFMINGVPTSPPQEVGVSHKKKFTVENFLGSVPAASIHMSLRFREDENHLRILLHEVKQAQKKTGSKSTATPQGHYFINAFLFPDSEKQGVRSCEVLSRVSDLENPQFYTISKQQLMSVALRVLLWEAKNSKHPSFVGEVLVSLSDRESVKLEGHPNWFTMCKTDPNLPPPPTAVPVKKSKKEDIFHRVRRGTGYALQSLRRPMSVGIDALAAENGPLSPSSSMEGLEASLKKLQGANVTMPRRTRKERKPLSALFNSPSHVPSPLGASTDQNGKIVNGRDVSGHVPDVTSHVRPTDEAASFSVPTSPLLSRRTARENGTTRRKKLGGILNALRGSLLPTTHSIDLTTTQRKRAATEAGEDTTDGDVPGEKETKRRWSLSGDVKHRIVPLSPPYSASSSPFSSPQHTARQPLASTTSSSSLDPTPGAVHRRVHSEISPGSTEYQWTDIPKSESADLLAPERTSAAVLSDGSWYSAEEELRDEETPRKTSPRRGMKKGSSSASKLLYSHSHTVDAEGVNPATKIKSRSAENLLGGEKEEEKEEEEEEGLMFRVHPPLARTRCHALSNGSSGSSVEEEYATANSRPDSRNSGSDEMGGDTGGGTGGGTGREESSLDSSTSVKAVGRANAISLNPNFRAISPMGDRERRSSADDTASSSGERISRWRSFEDLLGALPLKKKRPRWLRRNRTHHVSSNVNPSPLLKRRSSEPAFTESPPVGKVRLELTFNPDTSMVGVRLHEHTLSENNTDLTVQTYLYSRVSVDSKDGQQKIVSFKKTDYSHTLVASFTCDSGLADLTLQVSLETSGRFFTRLSGHVLLDLGPLLLPSPSLSCNQWFPLFHTPCPPPNNAHHNET